MPKIEQAAPKVADGWRSVQPDLFEDAQDPKSIVLRRVRAFSRAAGCEGELSNILAAVRTDQTLEERTLRVLEHSSKLAEDAERETKYSEHKLDRNDVFKAIVCSLDFTVAEEKLPQTLDHVPATVPQVIKQLNTIKELRRLGIPMTGETVGMDAAILAGCDRGLTQFEPSGPNPSYARDLYYRVLALNSVVDANRTGMLGSLPHYDLGDTLVLFRLHPEASLVDDVTNSLLSDARPPREDMLDAFLLSLPHFTEEKVRAMRHEQKLGIWHSRVKTIWKPTIRDHQMKFDFKV
jgi:hypothetical protein